MKTDLKKTIKAYGTVSEEKVLEEAKDVKETTQKLLEKEIEQELVLEEKEIESLIKEEEKKAPIKEKRKEKKEIQAEIIENWVPKTDLGKDVKSKKIKNIDEILEQNKKILEPEIVDSLLSIKTDLLLIGQAKGKFGGGKRRAFRQTQRITEEGGVMTFSCMAVAGDENGHIGIGTGKASETLPARDKAIRKSKLNLIKIKRGCSAFSCSCDEPHSIPFVVEGKAGSVRIKLMPAPQGTGLVVANELKKILNLVGIKDIYSYTSGKVRTTFNLAKACIDALEKTNRK